MTSKLKKLPVNKTVVFYSPIEGEDVLVRTGTISEGSSFFHAILHGYSREYVNMNRTDRVKFVRRLRASMAGKTTQDDWEELGGGLIAKMPFQEALSELLRDVYNHLDNSREIQNRATRRVIKFLSNKDYKQDALEEYKIITELIPYKEGFLDIILPKSYNAETVSAIMDSVHEETINYIMTVPEMKHLNKKKVEYIQDMVTDFISAVLKEAEKSAYSEYTKALETTKETVGEFTVNYISDRLNRNIYFLDPNQREPFNPGGNSIHKPDRKGIIILRIKENHYEVVGRLLSGNKIQRDFSPDDSLILSIQNFENENETGSGSDESFNDSSSEDEEEDPYYDSSDGDDSD